jgi:tRNA G37 N-methylase TrmD
MAKAVDIPKVREDSNHKKRENFKRKQMSEKTKKRKEKKELWQE